MGEEHMAEVIPALWGSEHDNISRPHRTPKTTKRSPLHEEARKKHRGCYGAVGSKRPTWRVCPDCEKQSEITRCRFLLKWTLLVRKMGAWDVSVARGRMDWTGRASASRVGTGGR